MKKLNEQWEPTMIGQSEHEDNEQRQVGLNNQEEKHQVEKK